MPAPRVKPMNPDHQRLIEDLLADPLKAMCPICGERGFWDNRTNKKNPKSPDFKCKNKDCPGATPLKGKSPYAVWIPEDYAPPVAPSSRRIPSPSPEVPTAGPPAFFADVPTPDSPDGDLITPPEIGRLLIQKREAIESAYRWAYDTAAAVQNDVWASFTTSGGDDMIPRPTAESIQAGAATLLIQAEKRGAI